MRKKPKHRTPSDIPYEERDVKFCERWLEHFDAPRAYQEAGFKGSRKHIYLRAMAKLERFAAHLAPLQQAKAQQAARQIAISQDDVLQAMGQVAFVNPMDYYVKTDLPVTRKRKEKKFEKIGDKMVEVEVEVEEPVKVGGVTLYQVRAKQIDELTREQISAVEIRHDKRTGQLSYYLPDLRTRQEARKCIGQNLGLFLEKVIYQNHQHFTKNVQLNVSAVPSDKLGALIGELLPMVGAEFAQFLGFSMEEIEGATLRLPPPA